MHKQYHLENSTYPDTHRIYEERLSIAGIHHYRNDAISFCRSREKAIYFDLDAANPYDRNAIRIMGRWKGLWGTKVKILGYVDADTASKIAALGLQNDILPRLLKTYVGEDDYIEIMYQIVGPKDGYAEYSPPRITPVSTAKKLIEAGDDVEAVKTLLADIGKEELEAKKSGGGVAARSYKALADFYKKQKSYDEEYEILERFVSQRRARGVNQDKLAERFLKARESRDKRNASKTL